MGEEDGVGRKRYRRALRFLYPRVAGNFGEGSLFLLAIDTKEENVKFFADLLHSPSLSLLIMIVRVLF